LQILLLRNKNIKKTKEKTNEGLVPFFLIGTNLLLNFYFFFYAEKTSLGKTSGSNSRPRAYLAKRRC
jgi:hypothetical protein